MKNPLEVLRLKEAQLGKLQEEVDALRLVGKLLEEGSDAKPAPLQTGKVLRMP